jgi:SAM-dependent methyltransferase
MLDRCLIKDSLQVLDVGCGAGNMIHHLSRYGLVKGIDNNPAPLKVAHKRGYDAQLASAEDIPFPDGRFDLVAALDLIEHCPDDLIVLRQCHRVCAPGGHTIITVPAYQWLWSNNDVINHHHRRYTASQLRALLDRVGFHVLRMTYNNTFIFPLAAGLILSRRGGRNEPELVTLDTDEDAYQVEMEPASPITNAILTGVGWAEAQLLRWISLPFGTSIICIARKGEEGS